ncbi:UDP-N-acetylglucosamine transporter [Nematostella vectensis]|nr:UDP-N-acetylglucosamine transporter [Nematostella vectensis]
MDKVRRSNLVPSPSETRKQPMRIESSTASITIGYPSPSKKRSDGMATKTLVFFILTFQAACYFLMVRYSRTRKGNMYFSSTVVVITELVKLCFSVVVIFCQSPRNFGDFLIDKLFSQRWTFLKLSIPSLLYTMQNNLLYLAMTHLDAATFQITNQLKIMTTALFSILLLNKSISRKRWFYLLMLMIGVAVVEIELHRKIAAKMNKKEADAASKSFLIGFLSVLAASVISGFAGVFLEKIVKHKSTSLWIMNVHLYSWGVCLGVLGVVLKDGYQISQLGFFYGYDSVVWTVVALASAGGILVSLVLKYASTITKGFATSCAIVLSSLASVIIFGFDPSIYFILGAFLVVFAVILYGI